MTCRAVTHRVVLVASLGVLPTAQGRAQPSAASDDGLVPGARIRVTMASPLPSSASGPTLVGLLAGSDRDELRLAVSSSEGPSEVRVLRHDAIVRLERSVGDSRRPRGAVIGFGVGLAAMIGKTALQGGCNDGCNGGNVATALLLASATAALGAIASPGERWEDVALERRRSRAAMSAQPGLRVRLVPQIGRRTGLTLLASF